MTSVKIPTDQKTPLFDRALINALPVEHLSGVGTTDTDLTS